MKWLLPLLGLVAAASLGAAEPTPASSYPYLAANCLNCHGSEGRFNPAIPSIAGRDKAFLLETLKAYKAGTKAATIMNQLAKGYTDEEIAALADYFSRVR
ncbi:MAG TPA: c-type cytochrome [Accumulibacter sp.]|uniref:c-type cytochrome n=1 Tax=Accumulibacter sp. TaxID=2053492 RepID=UPI0028795F61|nr:c-type cytochrome [Accumulibacter sp.]MDS4054059.1 cytochrome C [Accumulibacter sp.]HMV05333.1 c-type cytochrome [Accumulibacter sp.]HMW62299.1 c-type cytochrome [Accumulibacter sp.]HMW79351.1 c-type cytochrome [Accumulibacter sp.]HMX68464.1 c-type cytochrome [Accumulibacter sp.]